MGWTTAVPTNIKYSSGSLATTVMDISMTADSSGNLWAGFLAEGSGSQTLYVARYTNGAWSQAMSTSQTSEWGPALVWYGGALYMFWNYGDSTIHYGTINSQGACTDLGQIENPTGSSVAKTNSSPAGIAWNGSMWCAHLGWGASQTLYEDQYSSSQWGDDSTVPEQSSVGSPNYAATSGYQFLFHRGTGFNTGDEYWSVKAQSSPGYTSNQKIPSLSVTGGANRGFGAAAFGDDYVVAVTSFGKLQWSTCSINSDFQWSYQGDCGTMSSGSQAPGMCYLNGKMYMVFSDDSSNQLYMTTLSSIP